MAEKWKAEKWKLVYQNSVYVGLYRRKTGNGKEHGNYYLGYSKGNYSNKGDTNGKRKRKMKWNAGIMYDNPKRYIIYLDPLSSLYYLYDMTSHKTIYYTQIAYAMWAKLGTLYCTWRVRRT